MNITIITPKEQEDEYMKLLREAVSLIRKQGRSAEKYAQRINNVLERARKINGGKHI